MSRLAFVLAALLFSSNAFSPFDSQHGGFGAVLLAQGQQPVVRLTVADAITRAHETSHRLAEVRAREQGAHAAIKSAELARMPSVTATGSYVRTNHVREFSVAQPTGQRLVIYPDIPDNFSTRVGFQWP